jgi:DNA modification methylase
MCGNSVLIDDVERLMEGKKADMVFTDPPYNVKVSNISGIGKDAKDKHEEFVMASGEMSEEEFIQFLMDVFTNLVAVSKDGSIHYICMDWKHIYEIITAGKKAYTEFKQLCVWNKDNGGMGAFYRSKHELIFVFKHGTASHTNNFGLGENGRYRTNVWEYAGMGSLANKDRGDLLKMHPSVKPLALVVDAILDCSNRNELILDLFGGSGTTLIAAEKVGRKCCMMEMSPKYCDTIIRRWQNLTGQQAILESTGKTFDSLIDMEG